MDLTGSQRMIETPEADRAKLPAFYIDLEQVVAQCMDEIFRLAKSGEDDERKMKLVALEHRARLVLKRFRKRDASLRYAVPRGLFAAILARIRRFGVPPPLLHRMSVAIA